MSKFFLSMATICWLTCRVGKNPAATASPSPAPLWPTFIRSNWFPMLSFGNQRRLTHAAYTQRAPCMAIFICCKSVTKARTIFRNIYAVSAVTLQAPTPTWSLIAWVPFGFDNLMPVWVKTVKALFCRPWFLMSGFLLLAAHINYNI